ncbi:MAG: hypothetical protein WCR49_08280 [Opitutae bacterium]
MRLPLKYPFRTTAILCTLLTCSAGTSLAATGTTDTADVISLPMSDPARWVIDTSHLGTNQVVITYDAGEKVAVLTPTWTASDATSADLNSRNIQNSNLHLYQLVPRSDCTQSESFFEINVPQAYVNEGRLSVQYTLQGGEADDYLFNGRTFLMKDFAEANGGYKRVTLKSSDFSEPEVKRRGIQRVGFTLHRNGSMVSAPIRIRQITVRLNRAKIVPLPPEVDIVNPASFYKFTYTTQASIEQVQVENSSEARAITRKLGDGAQGMVLLPTWGPDQLPPGHSGVAYLKQSLGTPHNFAQFEVQYVVNIPRAYFDEGKLAIYLCIQAGEAGNGVWSGAPRALSSIADKAGQDAVLTLTQDDFLPGHGGHGKKRNKIEYVALQLVPHGSAVTEPIVLKQITVKLPK